MGSQRVGHDWVTKTFTESMLGWAVTPKAKTATVKVVPVRIVTSTASSSPGMLQASYCALSIAPGCKFWAETSGFPNHSESYSITLKKKLCIWLLWVLVVASGIFSRSMRDLVPMPGIEPGPPASGAWSLSHWTTREITQLSFNEFALCLNQSDVVSVDWNSKP